MRIKILKKIWNLKFVPRKDIPGCDGVTVVPNADECGTRGCSKDKPCKLCSNLNVYDIAIYNKLDDKEQLKILIHEMLHAADEYKTEDWVTTVAEDITEVIWKIGYRLES